jgi:hypothetical protein
MTSGTDVHIQGVRKSYGAVAALADPGAGAAARHHRPARAQRGPARPPYPHPGHPAGPSAGQVRVNGWRTTNASDRVEIRRRLGYLPQDLGLYPKVHGV